MLRHRQNLKLDVVVVWLYLVLTGKFETCIIVRAGIHGPKPIGPGPSGSVLVPGPDHDRKKLINPGPARTRTEKFLEFLVPDRTRTKKNF